MRLRDDETLSPEAERDLEALEAALAGRPAGDESLALLVRDLRAERPAPGPEFTAELDARGAEGFRGAGPAGAFSRLLERAAAAPPRRILAPAGALATLAVIAGVVLSQSNPGDEGGSDEPALSVEQQTTTGDQAPSAAGEAAPASPEIAPDETLDQPPIEDGGRQGLVPGQDDRKVERGAEITLSAENEVVPDVADGVVDVTDRYGGIVISSHVSESSDGDSVARLDLAIPTEDLQDALADLSDLADVSSRSESALDITEPFVTARESLSDARAELDSLLTQLAEADTPRETRSIRARIDTVREEIASARSELEGVARRARFAQVSVTVNGGGSGGWSLGDAADDAVDVLRTVAGVALVSAAVLLPVLLLGGIAWLFFRGAARRRRERALD